MYRKEIVYDRETRDYAMYLDGELVGFAPTYHAAEVRLDELVFSLLTHPQPEAVNWTDRDPECTINCPGCDYCTDPPPSDPPPEIPPGQDEYPGIDYIRDPRFDKRIARGDDYAGDAWRDSTGLLRWVAVGHVPH